ncbi:MAG TPA: hypothetical protein VN520_19910 [Streptomyces sp.]|uniref:hypothetical protein n=1 Tax=Streptomyces sp. TaxID=1931 RepID=UPI002C3999B5|nr:hypothetical protein [Streptomyces sp.]HWU08613.1 hypothetical protein [Streptomyces sp.]
MHAQRTAGQLTLLLPPAQARRPSRPAQPFSGPQDAMADRKLRLANLEQAAQAVPANRW